MLIVIIGGLLLYLIPQFYPKLFMEFSNFWLHRHPIVRKSRWNMLDALRTIAPLFFFKLGYSGIILVIVMLLGPEAVKKQPSGIELTLALMIVAVIVEELFFRGIWSMATNIIRRAFKRDYVHAFGIATSIMFGLVHITNFTEFSPVLLVLITSQTLDGFIAWFIAQRNGLFWAMVYHTIFNLLVLMLATKVQTFFYTLL
jgi:membrane protease YdiL (CAAX protease family)